MNGNVRILVVDNEHTREFIGHILETKKYNLSTVSSGEDVLNLLHKHGEWYSEHIDVLILDMAMSGPSGFDLIKIIKSNPKTEDLRVILLGDREGVQAMVDALFGGASDYVVKPFVVAELIARIENQLKHKRADEAQRELESRYQAIISMAEGVIVQDVLGRVLTTNPSADRILGTPQEQVMGRNFIFPAWHAIYEDGSAVHHDNYPTRVTLCTGQPLSNIIMGIQKPGSEAGIGEDYWVSADITWISINTRPLIHPGEEKPYAVVVSFSDITESKLMRDALRESEEKFRALTESSPSAVFIIQGEKYVYINPAFEALTGFSTEEISEIKFWDLVHNDMAQTVMEHGLARQQDNQPIPRLEHKIIAKNGEIKWLDYIATRIIYQGQPALMGTAIDITERKQAEETLRESRTLIDFNIIAAGIAQQILAPIDLCAAATVRLHRRMQDISKAFASEELDRTYIQDCINTATEPIAVLQTNLKRANELIESFTQMATYWIKQEKRQFDLKDSIDEVLLGLKSKYDQTKHSVTVICPDNLTLYSYPIAYMQIISNLVMNSLIHGFEGMEQGNIHIEVSKKYTPEKSIPGETETIMPETSQRAHLIIRYSDNGKGIDTDQIKKIYLPSFKTKRGEGGLGLGMHMVHTLVTRTLSGQIECTSLPGIETVFLIQIPLGEGFEEIERF